ncbi:hypothetical protein GCM10022419_006400 [Nonomuraea rosea]|uniref:Uncharacterized protein n=1 Tax=Nonomuraea rosea TaxID=638574 RepID=A0ABP6V7D3_9ACTN
MPPAPAMTGCQPSRRPVSDAYVRHAGTGPDPTVKLSPTNMSTGATCRAGTAGVTGERAGVLPATAPLQPDSAIIAMTGAIRERRVRPRMTTSGTKLPI